MYEVSGQIATTRRLTQKHTRNNMGGSERNFSSKSFTDLNKADHSAASIRNLQTFNLIVQELEGFEKRVLHFNLWQHHQCVLFLQAFLEKRRKVGANKPCALDASVAYQKTIQEITKRVRGSDGVRVSGKVEPPYGFHRLEFMQ